MRFKGLLLILLFGINSSAQNDQIQENTSLFLIPEFHVGKTIDANDGFPQTKLQTAVILSLGLHNASAKNEWASRLNFPKTGLALAFIDFGNSEKVGQAFTVLPFAEFKWLPRFYLNVGMGVSYMNTLYDEVSNPFNKAITTNLNWSFRSFLYYSVSKQKKMDWRLGVGYFHHSNGHTRLPNQGLNSILASVSAKINTKFDHATIDKPRFDQTSQTYISGRFGFGINTLSKEFNSKKEVYTLAFSIGKIINKTFKFGGGFYYRFYQHYYDYIKNEEELVTEEFPVFLENPFGYASNFGLYGTAELLLGHVGFEFELGLNIHKPFYQIDWKLNEGYSYPTGNGDEMVVVLGELNWYYEIKRTVSSRIGLKYYFINTNHAPKNNIFLGAHINANLGQADFTDLSLGYVYRFDL
ncbi:MAG: deacylase [Flavobacteriaceae bacterium]|nr:acyloxyacyl hydrolase [Bacteroidia bacterium]MBT8286814.1 acyloxyacyl hydrolase [Bacteroidia bacterium]NNF74268.1 deacylase [Flavobacteriaceae bacterium]NNK72582.1 deacylase [Flavobacteriaceae bacterium]